MFKFDKRSCYLSLVLLLVIIAIAMWVNDAFLRPFVGDVLIVLWMYSLLKSFINVKYSALALGVLFFSFSVEIAQYYQLVNILGLQDIKIIRIIIGSTFDWLDFLAYSIGWGLILITEKTRHRLASV